MATKQNLRKPLKLALIYCLIQSDSMNRKYNQTLISESLDLRTRKPSGAKPFFPCPGAAEISAPEEHLHLSSLLKPLPLHICLAYVTQ
jgi:hypothetical protein